jgi:hypothetical protein
MTSSLYSQRTQAITPAARRIVFLTAIIGFVSGYAASQMPHTLPFVRTSLELTEGEMSGVFAAVRAASLIGVVFTMAADRIGQDDRCSRRSLSCRSPVS